MNTNTDVLMLAAQVLRQDAGALRSAAHATFDAADPVPSVPEALRCADLLEHAARLTAPECAATLDADVTEDDLRWIADAAKAYGLPGLSREPDEVARRADASAAPVAALLVIAQAKGRM